MNWFKVMPLLGVALITLLWTWPAFSQEEDEEEPLPVIEGVVLLFSEIREEVFVFLDIDKDQRGDLWGRLDEDTEYKNVEDKEVDIDTITIGTRISFINYEIRDDFIVVLQAIELPAENDEQNESENSGSNSNNNNEDDNGNGGESPTPDPDNDDDNNDDGGDNSDDDAGDDDNDEDDGEDDEDD